MSEIDHFMYAVPSLEEGIAWAEQTFDVAPVYGGAHVGLGTRNALLSLGDTYLEIIAPDPEQSLVGNFGGQLAQLSGGGLVTWAARGALDEVAKALDAEGIAYRGPNRTERLAPDGTQLVWSLLFPGKHGFGPRMPFFIDWLECAHPCTTNPLGGSFGGLDVFSEQSEQLNEVFAACGLRVRAQQGPASLHLRIGCRSGEVVLSSNTQTVNLGFG